MQDAGRPSPHTLPFPTPSGLVSSTRVATLDCKPCTRDFVMVSTLCMARQGDNTGGGVLTRHSGDGLNVKHRLDT